MRGSSYPSIQSLTDSTHRIRSHLKPSTGYGIQIGHDIIYTFMDDANRKRLADWATNDNCAPQVGGFVWSMGWPRVSGLRTPSNES